MSEQIAIVGGLFGIWAELTGFSFLGIINVVIIIIKILLGRIQQQKNNCLKRKSISDGNNTKLDKKMELEDGFEKYKPPILVQCSDDSEEIKTDFGEAQIKYEDSEVDYEITNAASAKSEETKIHQEDLENKGPKKTCSLCGNTFKKLDLHIEKFHKNLNKHFKFKKKFRTKKNL